MPSPTKDDEIELLIKSLTDPARSQKPSSFLTDELRTSRPGVYAWSVDQLGATLFEEQLDATVLTIIYAGQAGATRWPSGRRSTATLASRIGNNHIKGNARSSTFRLTISALLRDPMNLRVEIPGRLDGVSRALVSDWIREHLRICSEPYDDRDTLGEAEEAVLQILDPPLNLMGMSATPGRSQLTQLRRKITHP